MSELILGDRCLVIWDQCIVGQFSNAPIEFSIPHPSVEKAFVRDSLTVAKYLEEVKDDTDLVARTRLQKYLLRALRDTTLLGTYSTYHDNAVYRVSVLVLPDPSR